MKKFKSFFASQIERYICHQKNLGYDINSKISHLKTFDRYLVETKVDANDLYPSLLIDFRTKLRMEPQSINGIFISLRSFFQFLVQREYYHINPFQNIPPLKTNTIFPYVFSPEEINNLLITIRKKYFFIQEHRLAEISIYVAILLIAKCGLRISEPLKILVTQYRKDEGTIYIEKTKFQNDRLIPLPKDVLVEINKFIEIRNNWLEEEQKQYLFLGNKQKGLKTDQIYKVFNQIVKDIGINQPRLITNGITFSPPTVHSLRHSFAINILNRIKESGKSPQKALPILTAYLGHRNIESTAKYLTMPDAQYRKNLLNFTLSHQEEI